MSNVFNRDEITPTLFLDIFNLTPALFNVFHKESKCSGSQFFIKILLFVAAAKRANAPASILSGIVLYSPPFNFPTPSIVMKGVPAPLILAPHEFKKLAKLSISGSQAQFFKIVLPLAREEAIIIASVPVTLMFLNINLAPISLPFIS